MSTILTDEEVMKKRIHVAIHQTKYLDEFEKKHWHKEIEIMSREQLMVECTELEKNGWFEQ